MQYQRLCGVLGRFATRGNSESSLSQFCCRCRNDSSHLSRIYLYDLSCRRHLHQTLPVCDSRESQVSPKNYQQSVYKSNYLIFGAVGCHQLRNNSVILFRSFHLDATKFKEESKLEQTVKVLKEQAAKPTAITDDKPKDVAVQKKTITQRVVAEIKHYYHGFRLLFIDVRVCVRLLWALLHGKSLSRRETKQLTRTTADLFRLVPFLVFVIVPFMEFLLPVAIKLFPSMLPSTFKEESKVQEKLKKNLKVKLEMAKFLQGTIQESALQGSKKTISMVEDFSNFMEKIRTSGEQASTEDIIKFSKLFEDEITLDNLSRGQLQALCRVLSIPTLGTDNFLRFQLRMKLRRLKADDKMIQKETIESLTTWELQAACRARGMRAMGVPEERLKSQLQQWLDLHLHEQIPTSLLLLSRALYLPETLSTTDQLQATLSKLPDSTADEAKIKIAELTGDQVDNKTKRDIIQQEEAAIKKEKDEKATEEEEDKAQLKKEQEAAEALQDIPVKEIDLKDVEVIVETPAMTDAQPAVEDTISSKDLEEIEIALEDIAEQKHLNIEKEELLDLKEDISEYREDLEDLKEVILSSGGDLEDLKESKGAKRLARRVDRLIRQSEDIVKELHEEKETIQEEIEVGEVQMKRRSEEKRRILMQNISEKKKSIISLNEMVLALKRLQKVPDETRLQKIVEVLDEDRDGIIDVGHVLKVIELLSKENIKLAPGQVTEVIELLKNEAELAEEERKKEKVGKEMRQAKEEALKSQ